MRIKIHILLQLTMDFALYRTKIVTAITVSIIHKYELAFSKALVVIRTDSS